MPGLPWLPNTFTQLQELCSTERWIRPDILPAVRGPVFWPPSLKWGYPVVSQLWKITAFNRNLTIKSPMSIGMLHFHQYWKPHRWSLNASGKNHQCCRDINFKPKPQKVTERSIPYSRFITSHTVIGTNVW